jgi:hypothetical protein
VSEPFSTWQAGPRSSKLPAMSRPHRVALGGYCGPAWCSVPRPWRWGSLWLRQQGRQPGAGRLSDWPVARPADWLRLVNRAQTAAELEAIRRCVQRGQPYGEEGCAKRVAQRLGLESTLRPRGRPPKQAREASRKGS